jgi:Uncharacterized protein conserved in bacteria
MLKESRINPDLEVVQRDAEALYIGNINTVEFDLKLPVKGVNGSDIIWESDNERIVSDTGKVNQPKYGMGSRNVNLIAFISYHTAKVKKIFTVRVLEAENKIKVNKIFPMILTASMGQKFYLPMAAAIETEEGRVVPHFIEWSGEIEFVYEKIGERKEYGILEGTNIPVEATIHVIDKDISQHQRSLPAVTFFDDTKLVGNSLFLTAQNWFEQYLSGVDDDQMLYNFRKAAGVDTKEADKMTGWDSPECLLRGHTTGHYLSGLALCYRATGTPEIRKKAVYMLQALKECQDAFAEKEGIHCGFLSGYSEEQFDLLEDYVPYPKVWAPYYTLHKILAGLLDCYEFAGIEMGRTIADKLGDWVFDRVSKRSRKQLMKMWSLYIAGETGGMNEVMARLYIITKKPEHLKAAKLFDNDKLFYLLSEKIDALDTMHANQHIPQVLGAMKLFEAIGEQKYYDIASFFWETVTRNHIYVIGGTGEGEMFHGKDEIGTLLTKFTAESCATYNMMKLTKALYQYHPKAGYMDYYERAMINHILSSCEHAPDGASTYFMPLAPGQYKEFVDENSCCHGTGMENHFKYGELIYANTEEEIYVNLFVPSSITMQKPYIQMKQEVYYGNSCHVEITLEAEKQYTLKIRKPSWCDDSYEIRVNNIMQRAETDKAGYINILVGQTRKETIVIDFPCKLHMEGTPDKEEIRALLYGPYVLAALTDQEDYLRLPFYEENLESLIQKDPDTLMFFYQNIVFVPLCNVNHEKYQVYFVIN